MSKVISFFDGREIEFEHPIELDNFGSVVGMSFRFGGGTVDVALASVEVGRIFSALAEAENKKERPNLEVISALERLDEFFMDNPVSLVAKCVIGTGHVQVIPDPPKDEPAP